ncbi:MAG: hypothetical protein M1386_02190 [Candidatus Thermoplasmatota archaeon]|nr:hypothetical protein [Candidatus Thermoplasmatota archaeon]
MKESRLKFFSNTILGYWVYVALLFFLLVIILFLVSFYFEYKNEAILLVLGAAISGLFGVIGLLAQDIQSRSRSARVFINTGLSPDLVSKGNKSIDIPIFLQNSGFEPGRDILVILEITSSQGNARLASIGWTKVPFVNEKKKSTEEYQLRVPDVIYPRDAEEPVIGMLKIFSEENGNYEIEVKGTVYERRGMTIRFCLFKGGKDLGNVAVCNDFKEFHSYY